MPQYLSKSLAAISTHIGSISTASPGVTTLNASEIALVFTTQRRVSFLSANATDFSAVSFTVVGTQEGGNRITDTIVGSSTGTTAWATVQDFLTITSVTASSVLNGAVTIQANTQGGTSWQPVNTCANPTNIGFELTYASTRTTLLGTLEYSYDNPPGFGPQNTLSSFSRPYPVTSTALSTTANTNTAGVCLLPIACWRMTITSTSTGSATVTSGLKVYMTALQTGLGSAL